jgi:hypothetical protein
VIAYHRHAAADANNPEAYAMVLLNFGAGDATLSLPFPQAGSWREMLDDDVRPSHYDLFVASDGASQTITVPSHYGFVFIRTG